MRRRSDGTPRGSLPLRRSTPPERLQPPRERREHGRLLALALPPLRPGDLLEGCAEPRPGAEPNSTTRPAASGTSGRRSGRNWSTFSARTKSVCCIPSTRTDGLQFMPFSDKVDYMTVLDQMHKALYHLNIGTDFVFPDSTNLSDYKVIVVPPLYVASDELLQRLSDYVRGGGIWSCPSRAVSPTSTTPFAGPECPARCARPLGFPTRSSRTCGIRWPSRAIRFPRELTTRFRCGPSSWSRTRQSRSRITTIRSSASIRLSPAMRSAKGP